MIAIYIVENGKLSIGGRKVSLPYGVEKVLDYDRGVIVLVEGQPRFDQNVYAVSVQGEVVWQVAQPTRYGEHRETPFRDIQFSEGGELLGWTSVGAEYVIDVNSGSIELRDFQRF